MNKSYMPEGIKTAREELNYSLDTIKKAMEEGTILEFRALRSDTDLNLYTYIGKGMTGVIHYDEIEDTFDGSQPKSIAVISKVGEVVSAKVMEVIEPDNNRGDTIIVLSRKEAQKECKREYLDKLVPGDIIDAVARSAEKYGLFCDVGCGVCALLPTDNFCVSRMANPKEDLRNVSRIKVVVKAKDESGRLLLTHKELLGTWEQEIAKFTVGDTVIGTVRSIQDYGIFVELTPNLSGLADVVEGVQSGDKVAVYIKSALPERMKVKLMIVSKKEKPKKAEPRKFNYGDVGNHIKYWKYSPDSCARLIETVFE